MLNSADSFLVSLLIIFFPSFALLIGTSLYSYVIIRRYSNTISRLYKMNFNSLEAERKRIANDLHDQLGYKMMVINKSMDSLSSRLNLKEVREFELTRSQLKIFHNDVKRILEAIHPRDLINGNWRRSITQLAQDLENENLKISVNFETTKNPKDEHLHHVYRIIQEKITNIISHTITKNIQITVFENNNKLEISIVYTSNNYFFNKTKFNLGISKGRGLNIINDRLKIIGASNEIKYMDGNVIDLVIFAL